MTRISTPWRPALDPERFIRWAAGFVIVLALALAAGAWHYRRTVASARARAVASTAGTARDLLRDYQGRVQPVVWQGILESFVPAFLAGRDHLGRTADEMRGRGDEWMAACACSAIRPDRFVLIEVEGAQAGMSEDGRGMSLDDSANVDAIRRLARNLPDDVRRFHALQVGRGPNAAIAHLRVFRDARGRRLAVAALIAARRLAPEVLEPIHRALLDDIAPSLQGRDSLFSLTVRLADGTVLYESPWQRAGVAAREGLWAANDSVVVGVLAVNPAMASHFVPGGIPNVPDTMIALGAALLVLLSTAALAALSQARRLMQARTLFLTGISHELRTPLTQVLTYAELLQRADLDAARSARARLVIVRESRRLIHMIENVLLFARGGSRRLPLNRRSIDLGDLVADILDDLGPLAERHDATAQRELQAGVRVRADAGAVRQILVNLVDNALRYGPPQQVIRVEVRAVGSDALLAVTDEGPGIATAQREAAWRPFVRLHADGEGTGIGLPLVRQLAEAMGGRADFGERAPGTRGLRVEVRLPLHVDRALAPEAAQSSTAGVT